ncbi:MAG: hypothetical protein Q8L37_03625 [Candidatus Gottesmanbacteria bacterium]|nr:hypothetical protein [Candidatus Gottesmanbacteria bacterium]
MTEPIPQCIALEPRREKIGDHTVLTIQMTSDGSAGADVVKSRGGRLVLVDGPGATSDGNRKRAEQVAELLLTNNDDQQYIAYQRIDLGKGYSFELKAAQGGYFIYWVSEDGILRPIPGYIGVDNRQIEVQSLRSSSLHDVRYAMMVTDGGLQLVLHPEVIGSIAKNHAHNAVNMVENLASNNEFMLAQDDMIRLLENFTNQLMIGGIEAIELAYRPYIKAHQNGDKWLDDDATFVLTSMK